MTEFGTGAFVMFANRLKKLKKETDRLSKNLGLDCYRIYSEDIPQIPVILDKYPLGFVLYDKSSLRFQTEEEQEVRFQTITDIVKNTFDIDDSKLFLKRRKKQKGKDQYEKVDNSHNFHWVNENGLSFRVNLSDYLDTGLFLDHRITRSWIREQSKHKSFLNLFSYTGSFSVYAASGGAKKTTSVDMSKTYSEWAKMNLEKNGFNIQNHRVITADVLQWIEDETKNVNREKYDIIFLDPPTFSNSKKMNDEWDVQSKHRNLILLLLTKFLNENGTLYFSTNFRKFKLELGDDELSHRDIVCIDRSLDSIPKDFRDKKIHQLFQFKLN
ncbi:class I SAM-dependent methyltransferase [Leptospira sp. 96542]|nr:class I SAM-dependent methyltransferase [Leptospira sp. 96542]